MDAVGMSNDVDLHNIPLDRRRFSTVVGDADQGDTCRICRGEGTLEQPLYYPCKCSGSIKFVHQDCLMEWLSHSQKKYCELCKTPFRFTKLYHSLMPETLPLPLFLKQVGVHAFRTSARWLRYVLVTFIWTCWLPWSIRQIWRCLFWLADGNWMSSQELKYLASASMVTGLVNTTDGGGPGVSGPYRDTSSFPTASSFDPLTELFNLLTGAPLLRGLLRLFTSKPPTTRFSDVGINSTDPALHSRHSFARQPSLLSNVSSLNSLTTYRFFNNGLVDILEGQLICLSVIAAFILVFLIREWVINQQPILNMPNPDGPGGQGAVAAPADEDGRQQALRRRRGVVRRPHDHDRRPDNPAVNDAQRPVAVPRQHHVAADGYLTTRRPPVRSPELPELPIRSSSLTPGSADIDNLFHLELDREDLYNIGNTFEIRENEPPLLQRGMLDHVVDIRRNMEERVGPGSEDGSDGLPYSSRGQNITYQYTPTSSSGSPLLNTDDNMSTKVERSDFAFGRDWQESGAYPTISDAWDFSSSTAMGDGPVIRNDDSVLENDDITSHQISHVRDRDVAQNSDMQPNLNPESLPTDFETATETHDVDTAEASPHANLNEPNVRDVDVLGPSNTVLGRIVHWMWHIDDEVRLQADLAEQAENHATGSVLERDNLRQRADVNGEGHPAQVAPNPIPHQPNVQFGIDLNDPNAIDDAEDLEGILELIGMEGPLTGMIQNIIFSVFLITLTLSASVWCPYIWGKIAILVMSNPLGVFFKAPLYFISKCGNILVDFFLFFGGMTGYGLSHLTKVIRALIAPALPGVAAWIRVAAIESWAYGISQNSGARLERAFSGTVFGLRPDLPTFSMQSHHALRVLRRSSVEAFTAIGGDVTGTLKNASHMWQQFGIFGVPVFVFDEVLSLPYVLLEAARKAITWCYTLNEELRLKPLTDMKDFDLSLVEWTTEDKVLAILIGYIFFAAAGYAYLKVAHIFLGLKKEEKVDGMFADSLRQAGGVLKVIVIIGIEMIVFPLYCGLLLDCALLPLFEQATFQSRFDFLLNAPVTCLFIHWFIGTCYMFHFALFVSMCRKILRKGVLYFIRDPDDPTFHPVRDVLERPVATQLGKIAFSALVYGGLVIVCLGGVVWTVGAISNILPLHWTTNEPRLAFPIDIVFYNFMLPFMVRRSEPSKKISVMYEWWFRQCARKLRLSHFLFGEEHEDEKRGSQPPWKHFQRQHKSRIEPEVESSEILANESPDKSMVDGYYVRAPAADSVRLPKGSKVFVEVNEHNERCDGKSDPDTGIHGKKDERFVKTYIPPHFRARISAFVFLVWVFAASTGTALTVLPLVIGRGIIYHVTDSKSAPNDLYAFTIGMHIFAAVAFVAFMTVTRRDKLQSKAADILTNARQTLPRLYQTSKHTIGLIYLFAMIFIVLPLTTSLLTELYVHMPLYSYFVDASTTTTTKNQLKPTIFVLQTWTLGLLYLRLALRILINYPSGQNRPSTAIRAITRNGYLHPDVLLATRALIFPALTICIVLLAAPLGFARILITLARTAEPSEKLQMYRYSYPLVLGMAITAYTAVSLQQKIDGWRLKIRDEVYLVGERLHNFSESQAVNNKKKSEGKGKAKVVQINEVHPARRVQPQSAQIVGHQFGESESAVASGSSRV